MRHSKANTALFARTQAASRRLPAPKTYRMEDASKAWGARKIPKWSWQRRDEVQPGDMVKISFRAPAALTKASGMGGETMHVEVTRHVGNSFEGILRNQPFARLGVKYGQKIKFQRRHIHHFPGD